MPARENPLISSQFTTGPGPQGKKTPYLTCKHCKWSNAKNVSRAIAHLDSCDKYAARQGIFSEGRPAKRQHQLPSLSLPAARKQRLDQLGAMAIYMGARPFQLFEENHMKQFIIAASDNLYTPPHRRMVGGELLEKCYNQVRGKVEVVLTELEKLNFVLDESPNINSQRMVNLSVVTQEYGSFFLGNYHVGSQSLSASFFVEWFIHLTSPYDLARVSSLTTDTCATMRKTWEGLEKHESLKHTLFIPCDSHGLQLLIKDLLESPQFSETMKKA